MWALDQEPAGVGGYRLGMVQSRSQALMVFLPMESKWRNVMGVGVLEVWGVGWMQKVRV